MFYWARTFVAVDELGSKSSHKTALDVLLKVICFLMRNFYGAGGMSTEALDLRRGLAFPQGLFA